MRGSVPITSATAVTSAPARSDRRASAFAYEIFRARKALQACFASSAVWMSVSINRLPPSDQGARTAAASPRTSFGSGADQDPVRLEGVLHRLTLPQELRVGDDLDVVRQVWAFQLQHLTQPVGRSRRNRRLLDHDDGPVKWRAIARAERSTATTLASPEAFAGVPTQMNTTSAPGTAPPGRP